MNPKPLLIITRPKESGQTLCDEAIKQGMAVLSVPVLQLNRNHQALLQLKQTSAQVDALFFVSPAAIRIAAEYVDWPHFSGSLVALSATSAQLLTQISHKEVIYPSSGIDSEALLNLPFWQKKTGRLMIVRADEGRDFLANSLRQIGWQVDFCAAYQREKKPFDVPLLLEKINQHHQTAVFIGSSQAADAWFANIPPAYSEIFKNLLYLTIHQRIADKLHKWNIVNSVVCQAENSAILNELNRRWGK